MQPMPLVFIVPGHGQRGGRYDPGATAPGIEEALSVREIAGLLATSLREMGVEAIVDAEGHYRERHRRLQPHLAPGRRCAVLHLHHNAGGAGRAKYALAMHDRRSRGGAELAGHVAGHMRRIPDAPWGPDSRSMACWDDRPEAGQRAWLHRAWGCIDEVFAMPSGVSACLIEGGFVDHPATVAWLDRGGRRQLAEAIAHGAAAWLR